MAKRKKTTIAQEVDKAAKLLQRLVRLKASDENGYCQCVTCGKIDHYKSMQGGHFYSRRHLVFKLFEENLHPQCAGCNLYGKFDRKEVIQFAQQLKEQIKEQESRIGEI